jgi:selenocysteine-specific elongation factor
VLDTRPTRYGFRTDARKGFLKPLAENPLDVLAHLYARLTRDHNLDASTPLHDHPFSEKQVQHAMQKFLSDGESICLENAIIYAPWWNDQKNTAIELITAWHKQHPDVPGISLDLLANSLEECPEDLFTQLLTTLESSGFKRTGKILAASTHTLTLPAEIKTQADNIIARLDRSDLQPPSPADLTTSTQHSQALQFLIRSGRVIQLEPKVVISASSRDDAVRRVREHLEKCGQATASELRQHLGSTRKVVMPLLEHLDDLGITVRNDNYRTLK